MNNIAAKIVLTSVLATSSTAVLASDKWEKESMDAWLDGKAETTLLLNSNLNSFDINTDVENQVVTLSGSVNNDLEKSLFSPCKKAQIGSNFARPRISRQRNFDCDFHRWHWARLSNSSRDRRNAHP